MPKIKIYIEREQTEKEIETSAKTIAELLKELNIPSSEFVIVKNDEVVTEDEKIQDGDYIKIIDVVSGG